MLYADYLKSEDWRNKRDRKRFKKNKCGICGEKKSLHVHHLNYKNLTDVEQTDLRMLCKWCHFLVHKLQKEGVIKYKNKNHHSKFAILKIAVLKHHGVFGTNMFALADKERDLLLNHT